ncbi:MAG: roadblock/LC7 domain-containing protein [Promethearchaeota archaeon]
MNNSNLEKSKEAQHLLSEFNQKGNLESIIFAYRDGSIITEITEDGFNIKNFTSMCASVLESALGIGETMGNRRISKIITELEKKNILIYICDNKTFLILILKNDSNTNLIFNQLDGVIQNLVKLY